MNLIMSHDLQQLIKVEFQVQWHPMENLFFFVFFFFEKHTHWRIKTPSLILSCWTVKLIILSNAICVLNFSSLSVHQKNGEGPIWCCIFNFMYTMAEPTSYSISFWYKKKGRGGGMWGGIYVWLTIFNREIFFFW